MTASAIFCSAAFAAALFAAPTALNAQTVAAAAVTVPVTSDQDLWMEFGQAKPGEEQAFAQWSERHLRDLAAVPGVVSGQRYNIEQTGNAHHNLPASVTFYVVKAGETSRLAQRIEQLTKDGRLSEDPAADATQSQSVLLRPLWPAVLAKQVPGTDPTPLGDGPLRDHYLVVFSDPSTPDKEDAFNRWYDLQHVPDVLRVPGFASAQRFIRIGGETDFPRYLVIFHFYSRDLEATNHEIGRRIKEKITVMSDAFGTQRGKGFMATAASPEVK
jgi:antibiotic biosynthesis monooxygenase (ABM) superfamily enzyme